MNAEPKTLPLVLNQSNALTINNLGPYKKYLSQSHLWHKFIVHDGASLDREKILKCIIEKAMELFPIQYKADGNNATFIARNCCPAIETLCRQNLIVEYPGGQPLILSIILNGGSPTESKTKIQNVILNVLHKRFNKQTSTLNLENLVKDSALNDIYCSLSQPKILAFVLSLAKNLNIKCLRLNNNEIKNFDTGEVLWACRNVKSIDLRNNLLENLVSIYSLKNMQIVELWLDGNPLCQNYDEARYLMEIKNICPSLEKLDGVLLGSYGMPALRRNFLCKLAGQEFVDQFLEHYFTLYDSKDRKCLDALYHPRAVFSQTCHFLPGHVTSATAKLESYKRRSRNLLTMSDFSKNDKYLAQGSANIVTALSELPPTEHDPYMFTIDLLYYNESSVVILVTGVFREPVENMLEVERCLGFTRTFVLCAAPHGEFNIINEELHISNATTIQAQRAFKVVRVAKSLTNPSAYTPEEKNEVIETMARITTLNMEYSKKLLAENNWELKKALGFFVDKYKDEKIPREAFKV